jgi:hypothetical protein
MASTKWKRRKEALTVAKKKPQEDIVLYASLETEEGVEVELAVYAPTRVGAQKVIADITRAVTGVDQPQELGSAASVVLTEDSGGPSDRTPPTLVKRPEPDEEKTGED